MNTDQTKSIPHFKIKGFGKDLLVHSSSNIYLLLLGFVQVFLIAKNLTAEGYGQWQLFILYTSYVALLVLGFVEGVHISWAGKQLQDIKEEINIACRFVLVEQIILVLPAILAAVFLFQQSPSGTVAMILIYTIIWNISYLFIGISMAIRQFISLAIVNVVRGTVFFLLVVIGCIYNQLNPLLVTIFFIFAQLIALLVFIVYYRSYLKPVRITGISWFQYGLKYIKTGVFVLLGSYVVTFFLTMDRLLVSNNFPIGEFAIYAFAVSAMVPANQIIRAISEVFFPHISSARTDSNPAIYSLTKSLLIMAYGVILVLYFPITELIQILLPQYVNSLTIVKLLFCTIGFSSLIQILQTNYYLINRMQRSYLIYGIIAIVILVIMDIAAIKIVGTLSGVAIATQFGFVLWFIINEIKLHSVTKTSYKELGKDILSYILYSVPFLAVGLISDSIVIQMIIYIGVCVLVTTLLFRNEVIYLIRLLFASQN